MILPGVFSPKHFPDAIWFAKEISKIVKNKSFLEIGTGCGLESLFVAIQNPENKIIVATDINPHAVTNAKINFKKYNLNIEVLQGDLFKPLTQGQRFDIIFWNHPFHFTNKKPQSVLITAGFDYKYKSIINFFENAERHLNNNGEIILGTGSPAQIDYVKEIARRNGYYYTKISEDKVPFDNSNLHNEMTNYIFSFKKQIN